MSRGFFKPGGVELDSESGESLGPGVHGPRDDFGAVACRLGGVRLRKVGDGNFANGAGAFE